MANHHFASTFHIFSRENSCLSPAFPVTSIVKAMADTDGIKTPNNLVMLLKPSEICDEANIKKIHIDHERINVRIKNFGGDIVPLALAMLSATFPYSKYVIY